VNTHAKPINFLVRFNAGCFRSRYSPNGPKMKIAKPTHSGLGASLDIADV